MAGDVEQSTMDPSLSMVKYVPALAPVLLVAIGYMDPGTWACAIEGGLGGSRFGFELLWVVIVSNIMVALFQTLATRLGLVSGKHLAESFSKSLVFLSIATAVTSAIEEARIASGEDIFAALDDSTHRDHSDSDSEEPIRPTDQRALTLHLLKEELEDKGITLPERMDAVELGRFLIAANGNVSNFIAKVKKTVQWRGRHHILFSAAELKRREHLVYWHRRNAQGPDQGRPALIIRLGLAFTVLMLLTIQVSPKL